MMPDIRTWLRRRAVKGLWFEPIKSRLSVDDNNQSTVFFQGGEFNGIFYDPIQQRKAMTEAGFSVSEQNIILAEVQNTHYCTDEKPPVPEGMPYVDHDALAEEVSQMTGIDLPTTFYVLTWEFVLELYRPKPEIILSLLAAEISSFTGIEESSVYHILLAQDEVFRRIGLYDTEEDDWVWYAIDRYIYGDDL